VILGLDNLVTDPGAGEIFKDVGSLIQPVETLLEAIVKFVSVLLEFLKLFLIVTIPFLYGKQGFN
jgi:hypothetical protein